MDCEFQEKKEKLETSGQNHSKCCGNIIILSESVNT